MYHMPEGKKYLDDHGFTYEERDIKKNPPTRKELNFGTAKAVCL